MKLHSKRVLLLVGDGVSLVEVRSVRMGLLQEGAEVFTASPHPFLYVETVEGNHRGANIEIDLPLDAVEVSQFDALVVPGGYLSAMVLSDSRTVRRFVRSFHEAGLPIIASDQSKTVLTAAGIITDNVVLVPSLSNGQAQECLTGVILEGTTYQLAGISPSVREPATMGT